MPGLEEEGGPPPPGDAWDSACSSKAAMVSRKIELRFSLYPYVVHFLSGGINGIIIIFKMVVMLLLLN